MKTVNMKFPTDQYYGVSVNGDATESLKKPLYEAGKVYPVPENMVARWLKRGGEIVEDEAEQAKVEEKTEETEAPTQEQVEGTEEKSEDEAKPPTKPQASKPQNQGNKKR